RAFTVWIGRVLLPAKAPSEPVTEFNDLQEVQAMLAERVKLWVREWKQEGHQEGFKQRIEIGESRGESKTLLKLIKLKFGSAPEWVERKIDAADKTQLDAWVERIIVAESIDHLFG
ncbi:MAG: Rpn family recombination-promoting nuclease/putative transposase, partial [Methylococcales bacterium]